MNILDLVGKRCLLSVKVGYHPAVNEYKVLEVSPNGNWVKLMNINGYKAWYPLADVSLVDILKDLKADKPKE